MRNAWSVGCTHGATASCRRRRAMRTRPPRVAGSAALPSARMRTAARFRASRPGTPATLPSAARAARSWRKCAGDAPRTWRAANEPPLQSGTRAPDTGPRALGDETGDPAFRLPRHDRDRSPRSRPPRLPHRRQDGVRRRADRRSHARPRARGADLGGGRMSRSHGVNHQLPLELPNPSNPEAAASPGLPAAVDPMEVFRFLRSPSLAVSAGLPEISHGPVLLLRFWLRHSPAQDWQAGGRPVVFATMREAAAQLNVTERTARRYARCLRDAGAWTPVNRPGSGPAQDVDLSPLAGFIAKLRAIAERQRALRA
ncbi:MAG: hypothetical protein F4Y03_18940 [Alphaproteobacteria bacterium]|nr:hypothetical protein [Alphaproteobacteria bacterium]